MVQIINDEYSGNIFGRLGKGIGKGLSEQLPKEIERSRLSSGLKKFEEQSGGLSPVQQYTRLAAIPGITPEHLYTLSPLLRQQAARDEGSNRKGNKKGDEKTVSDVSASANKISSKDLQDKSQPSPYSEPSKRAEEKNTLKSLQSTRAQLEPIVKKSPEELFSEATLLSQKNNFTYPTPADAMPFVQENENTRIANLEEQRKIGDVADNIKNRVKQGLENRWGKENTAKGIPGTIQSKLLDNLENELADPYNKLSEQQLINKWGDIGKRIAQTETNLDARARQNLISGDYSRDKIFKSLNNAREVYKDADALEEFQNDISSKFRLSSGRSAYIAYPPNNSEANKIIKSLPSPVINEKGVFYPGKDPTTLSIRAADQLNEHLGDNDSLLTYALEMKQKGLDPKVFIDRVNQNVEAGLFDPNDRQRQELINGLPSFPSIGDIWLFTLGNKEKLVSK